MTSHPITKTPSEHLETVESSTTSGDSTSLPKSEVSELSNEVESEKERRGENICGGKLILTGVLIGCALTLLMVLFIFAMKPRFQKRRRADQEIIRGDSLVTDLSFRTPEFFA